MIKYVMAIATPIFMAGVLPEAAHATENISIQSKDQIVAFQKAHGLVPDGIIGPKTRAAARKEDVKFVLEDRPSKAESTPLDQLVAIGSDREYINKGLKMVGMDARSNRKELRTYLSKDAPMTVDPVRIPWCAAWANRVLADSGYQTTSSLLADSFLHYGIAMTVPNQGDIVILRRGRSKYASHVGFFIQTVEVNGRKYVAVLGGNQSDRVKISYYEEEKVLSYRKPVVG